MFGAVRKSCPRLCYVTLVKINKSSFKLRSKRWNSTCYFTQVHLLPVNQTWSQINTHKGCNFSHKIVCSPQIVSKSNDWGKTFLYRFYRQEQMETCDKFIYIQALYISYFEGDSLVHLVHSDWKTKQISLNRSCYCIPDFLSARSGCVSIYHDSFCSNNEKTLSIPIQRVSRSTGTRLLCRQYRENKMLSNLTEKNVFSKKCQIK